MSLRKVTVLGSNLASVMDLKEFKLHTVYAVISEVIILKTVTTRWSGGRVQV